MHLRLLEDVIALLDAGSLNSGAARRNVTQPAFSRRVRAFEDWVGRPLIERGTNRVALHPALTENEHEIRSILSRLSELRETIASHDGIAKRVTVVSQHSLSAGLFPEICRGFLEDQPDLTFRLRTRNRKECISIFMRNEADMLLCYQAPDFPPMPFDREIRAQIWRRDHLIPIVSRSILDDMRAIADLPRIVYPEESHFGRLIVEHEKRHGHAQLSGKKVLTSAFSNGVLALVRARFGVGWVPQSLAAEHLTTNELTDLQERIGRITIGVTLYALRSNPIGSDLLDKISLQDDDA